MQLQSSIQFHDERFLMFVIDEMAYEYEKQYDDVIRLTLGKSELPTCAAITCAMEDALRDPKRSALVFPAGLPELKARIAQEYNSRYGAPVNPRNVIIGVGTSSIFRNIFYLLAREGDEVLLPLPYYPLYEFCAMLVGATVRYYEIDTETMGLNIPSFQQNFTDRTKIVVLNSPGNPLGNILSLDDIRAIDSIVDGRAMLINDEIYSNITFEGETLSFMQLPELQSPFIVTNSFSKGYRMYSRRVGYCIVPDELVEPLTVIQHHTLLTVDPVPQYGAIAALDHPEEVDYLVALYKSRRDYTLEAFKSSPYVKALSAAGSFYLTLECGAFMVRNGIADCLDLARVIMEQTHVATVPGLDFGLPDTLRLSFSAERYNEGIDRLVAFFAGHRQGT